VIEILARQGRFSGKKFQDVREDGPDGLPCRPDFFALCPRTRQIRPRFLAHREDLYKAGGDPYHQSSLFGVLQDVMSNIIIYLYIG
jgi:hypothetical protein